MKHYPRNAKQPLTLRWNRSAEDELPPTKMVFTSTFFRTTVIKSDFCIVNFGTTRTKSNFYISNFGTTEAKSNFYLRYVGTIVLKRGFWLSNVQHPTFRKPLCPLSGHIFRNAKGFWFRDGIFPPQIWHCRPFSAFRAPLFPKELCDFPPPIGKSLSQIGKSLREIGIFPRSEPIFTLI